MTDLDFLTVKHRVVVKDKRRKDQEVSEVVVYATYNITPRKHIMTNNGFLAAYNPETGLWTKNEEEVVALVDGRLSNYAKELSLRPEYSDTKIRVSWLGRSDTNAWVSYRRWLRELPRWEEELDVKIFFRGDVVKAEDYCTRILPYELSDHPTPAFDALFKVLYDEGNLKKLLWGIGAIFSGEGAKVQKFFVLFGPPGSGKSTFLHLLELLFPGYTESVNVSAFSQNDRFALAMFSTNPLVAIDHEGNLSKLSNNSMLNALVSHDSVSVDVKFRNPVTRKFRTLLFVATNKPVAMTDIHTGLGRRLLDVRPTGMTVSTSDYLELVNKLPFELGSIAHKAKALYEREGHWLYDGYVPSDMFLRTNHVYNFIQDHESILDQPITTLKQAWELYKVFCDESGVKFSMSKQALRDELRGYWDEFHPRYKRNGINMYSVFVGFNRDRNKDKLISNMYATGFHDWLVLDEHSSVLDEALSDSPAQYHNEDFNRPNYKWENVKTKLTDLNTKELHYVLPPEDMVILDFDLSDENGKSLALNLAAARHYPPTYAETSKSGKGLHLHYYYEGDIEALAREVSPGVEILKPVGNFSIRRKLTLCNDHPITTVTGGLPLREKKGDKMYDVDAVMTEKTLRKLIQKGLMKRVHSHTKPSIDFIDHILGEAFASGAKYDVSDLRTRILSFAMQSTNSADYCMKTALAMKYKSDHEEDAPDAEEDAPDAEEDARLVFFDVESYPNLFVVCWKYEFSEEVYELVNPTSDEVDILVKNNRLVGFNNRRYDNHILYASILGHSPEAINKVSSRIIENDPDAYYKNAWSISFADLYEITSEKKSLKEWEVDLEIKHMELELPWDEEVPVAKWPLVVEYCKNDVRATEALYHARRDDWVAREMLCRMSGLNMNASTMNHVKSIVFGKDKPTLVYTDLRETFPGYEFQGGKSSYRGIDPSEGGYVYARPGMYGNVLYADVASMHPTSIIELSLFGRRTSAYAKLMKVKKLLQQRAYEEVSSMFNGKFDSLLKDEQAVTGLIKATKLVLNTVYGYTSASFENPFRDHRNVDNIVAKRGALFMIDLQLALEARGSKLVHIKTDSVKIADHTPEDIDFLMEFGRKYGYEFAVEGVYEKLVLINDAVLVGKINDKWVAVGARFAVPYVFKTLFTKEEITLKDLSEKRKVKKGHIVIVFPDGSEMFVGRVGVFVPVKINGGELFRAHEDKKYALPLTKGVKFLPYDRAVELVEFHGIEKVVDFSYYEKQVKEAQEKIAEFGDTKEFLGD